MAMQENRLSTQVVASTWLSPDERTRDLDEDYEKGPLALNDTSLGLDYQVWKLTWNFATGDFTATPETSGSPVVVLNVASITQCSLAFDQNGHINIAYTAGGQAYLYWFDTLAADWVTTALDFGVITPTLCLDDKRVTQTSASDILLLYTMETATDIYTLFHRQQRDRFLIEYEHETGVPPYLYKLGMHDKLRVQIGLSATVL